MIKKFEKFVNEELDNSTYLSAAKKLKDMGHVKRSKRLTDHINPDVEYITLPIKFDDKVFKINTKQLKYVKKEVPYFNVSDNKGNQLFDVTSKGFFSEPEQEFGISKLEDRKSAINLRKLIINWFDNNPIEEDIKNWKEINVNWLYQE